MERKFKTKQNESNKFEEATLNIVAEIDAYLWEILLESREGTGN